MTRIEPTDLDRSPVLLYSKAFARIASWMTWTDPEMDVRTIAYLTPLYFDQGSCLGGGERFPWNLAKGVAETAGGRYRVELLSFSDAPSVRPIAPGVTLRLLTAAGKPRHPLDVVSWDLPEAIAGADLVHIHQAYNRCAEVGLLVAKQQRKPVCVTDHGGYSSPLVKQLGLLDMVDRVVAYSDFGASLYRTSTPVTVIKGGVDASKFTPPPVPVERDRVVYVGRLLPHKGIDQLITALPAELPLTVCGQPYHPDYFERLKALAEGKRVEFLTDADDAGIMDLYRRAWAGVLPSVYVDCYGTAHEAPELMGLTLLEAMACATPAVASRVAAMPEFVRDGETGYVFDSLDELTDRLLRLAAEPGLADRLGGQARLVVEREFDLRVAGARLVALYDELIGRAGAAERAA
jgi:glycosyltransferase involved in cell wall biosynthesis